MAGLFQAHQVHLPGSGPRRIGGRAPAGAVVRQPRLAHNGAPKGDAAGDATLLLLEGANMKIVSERLGHSNIGITADIYSHVLPELDREAANTKDHH